MPDAPNIRPIAAQPQGKLPAVHIGLRIQLVVCRAIRIDDAVADRPAEGSHGITVDLGIVAAVGDGIVIVSGSFLKVLQITQEKGQGLLSCYHAVRFERGRGNAIGNTVLHRPADRRVKPVGGRDVREGYAGTAGGAARHAIQRRHDHCAADERVRFKLRGRGPVHQAIIGYIVDRVKVIRKSRTSHVGIGRGQRYGERNQQRSEQKDAA